MFVCRDGVVGLVNRSTHLVSGDNGGCDRLQQSDNAKAAARANTAQAPPADAQSHADVALARPPPSPDST